MVRAAATPARARSMNASATSVALLRARWRTAPPCWRSACRSCAWRRRPPRRASLLEALPASSPSLKRLLGGLAALGVVACAVPLAVAIHSVGGHHRDLIAVFGPIIGGAVDRHRPARLAAPPRESLRRAAGGGRVQLLPVRADRHHGLLAVRRRAAVASRCRTRSCSTSSSAFPSGRLQGGGGRSRWSAASYLFATVGWWVCLAIDQTARARPAGQPAARRRRAGAVRRARPRAPGGRGGADRGARHRGCSGRWRGATRPQRRALTLVYASGGLVLGLYAVWAVLGVSRRGARDAGDTRAGARRGARDGAVRVPRGLLRGRVAGGPRSATW